MKSLCSHGRGIDKSGTYDAHQSDEWERQRITFLFYPASGLRPEQGAIMKRCGMETSATRRKMLLLERGLAVPVLVVL